MPMQHEFTAHALGQDATIQGYGTRNIAVGR
jgi:hypothetical protein